MVWSIEIKDNHDGPKSGFFDFLHNLKDFITEKFASFKETLISLNILKGEITSSSSREDTVSNPVHSNPEAAAVMVSESSEREHVSLKDKLTQICVRSRTYWGVNKDDCWSVSFWKLQFHWAKAEKILNAIKTRNPSRYSSIMMDPLFSNIKTACASKRNDTHVAQYQRLMQDSGAKHEMDKIVDETIQSYLDLTHTWWVSDPRATLAFWRICNYWPRFAEKIKDKMVRAGADINDYNQVIDYYEQNTSWTVRTKFQRPVRMFWTKNLRQVIWEYTA